jgi:uridine kinase
MAETKSSTESPAPPSARPAVRIIGVAGGSGSGKTTFARELHAALGPGVSAVLTQDHYYIDQSAVFRGDGENVNFDHPDSLDFSLLAKHLLELRAGRPIQVPIYDFATHTRLPQASLFLPVPVVIVDGILILSQALVRPQLDFSVFIAAPEQVRFDRRLERDVAERGRTPEGVRKQFDRQVKPMHDLFVEPSRRHADEVISGLDPFEGAIARWMARVTG